MEQKIVLATIMVLFSVLLTGVIAAKFMPRTDRHLRFGSLFLDSFADAVLVTWLVWILGQMFGVSWLSWWYNHAWSIIGTLLVAMLLIPLNKSFIRHRIARQDQKQQALTQV